MMLRQERIIVYECSWVCIIQPDRSFEVAFSFDQREARLQGRPLRDH